MVYRDDRDALLARADALERERDEAKQEAETLRAENERLRAPKPKPEPEPEPAAPVEVAKRRPRTRPKRRWNTSLAASGATALLTAGGLVTLGAPIVLLLTLPLGMAFAVHLATLGGRSTAPHARGVPLDTSAYEEIRNQWRGAHHLRLEVRFATVPLSAQREELKQSAIRYGLRAEWKDDALVLVSKKLRTRELVEAFCQSALGWLALVSTPIAKVTPRRR